MSNPGSTIGWSPEPLDSPQTTQDQLARWGVCPETRCRVADAYARFRARGGTARPVVTSGVRRQLDESTLAQEGYATVAPGATSTHVPRPGTECSEAVDIDLLGISPTTKYGRPYWQLWGECVLGAGLRWGGGSKMSEYAIPADPYHIDLGPWSR